MYKLEQRIEQVITLSINQLETHIRDISGWHASGNVIECIDLYLKHANYELNSPNRHEKKQLRIEYITTVFIHEFLCPFLDMEFKKYKEKFIEIAETEYHIDDPFRLKFNTEKRDVDLDDYRSCVVVKSIDELSALTEDLGIRKKIEKFDELRKKILRRAVLISRTLKQAHSYELQLDFLIYSRIVPYLVGLRQSEVLAELHKHYEAIAKEHGNFKIEIPFIYAVCKKS